MARPKKIIELDQSVKVEDAQVIPLADYIAIVELKGQPLAVVQVSHPDATGDIFNGTYAGIRTVKGAIGAVLSDGTRI